MRIINSEAHDTISVQLQAHDTLAWRKYVPEEITFIFIFSTMRLFATSTMLPSWVEKALTKKAIRQAYAYRSSLNARKNVGMFKHPSELPTLTLNRSQA